MPRLREDQRSGTEIDLRHRSARRVPTDAVVLVDDGLPELPPEPVFSHEPVGVDAPGAIRRKRRVAELEEIAAANAEAAREARGIALEQRGHLEAAVTSWRAAAGELIEVRRELKSFAAARADLVARERERAEQTARTDVTAELQHTAAERDEMRTEVERLRVALADQQSVHADTTHRLRDEQRRRDTSEKEATRAIAAYETAERRLEAARDALQRSATDEQARIEAIEAERAAAVAELDALGGGERLTELSNRVEDLVSQLAELDTEVVEMRSRAEVAEERAELAATDLAATRHDADEARAEAASVNERLDEIRRERDALRVEVASLEEIREQADRRSADTRARVEAVEARVETAEAERDAAVTIRDDLRALLAERDAELSRAVTALGAANNTVTERDVDLSRAVTALGAANNTVVERDAALASARSEVDDARIRVEGAQDRLEEMGREHDFLRGEIARLEEAVAERDHQPADDLAREQHSESAGSADLEVALVSARADADALRHETTALAAQLEEAWAQVEEARRIAESERAARKAATCEAASSERAGRSADGEETVLDALTELATDPVEPVEPVDPDVRVAPTPDPDDPDARRAALGFLNSLATDLPASASHRS